MWRGRALCGGMNPRDFDTDIGGVSKPLPMIEKTAQVCGGCPVRVECLGWALRELPRSPDMNLIAGGSAFMGGKQLRLLRVVA